MIVIMVEEEWIWRHTRRLCRDNRSMSRIDNRQRNLLLPLSIE